MRGCLSEFLNLLEIRGQNWCLVDLGEENGIRSPSGDAVYFYAVLEGAAKLSGVRGSPLSLGIGDVVMVMPGQAHAIRTQAEAHAETIGFLAEGQYADFPPSFAVGEGAWAARLLCGRLTVRWPGGLNPAMLPASLSVSSDRTMVNMEALLGGVQESGGAAVLTRAAALLLTSALRAHPDCQMLFHDAQSHDPIGRAIHYMEVHPFQDWTVAGLAQKVGMGRSTFAARFLHEAGRAPMEVLTEIRMRLAVTLLTETRLKVAEIGERVGYRSESAFSRRFAAFYNRTPGQMRQGGEELTGAA